ncbi:ricin-type beta-trefoil lectin protein [Nonomuraea fuscirosea]|uniref:Ricin-type beta-trefoil lectin protein n=1 Tax=Nonomuraea fuscirosea TaxID=1291556 RepID=A0A2T0MXZ2_9ACTN|nr:RICIN domain-containing protein [Nonomuraea fuscirosea]PRX64103.1 ricin-type beta-trefoil lectin protein [Nonomuraea fuscirosea]
MHLRRLFFVVLAAISCLLTSAVGPAFADPAPAGTPATRSGSEPPDRVPVTEPQKADLTAAGFVPADVALAAPAPLPGASAVFGPYYWFSGWATFRYQMCLDADKWVTGNGAKVQLWECNGLPQQSWWMHKLGNSNKYLIQNALTGMILDGHLPCVYTNGCQVQMWQHVPGNLNQVWFFWQNTRNGRYFFELEAGGKYLDVDSNTPRGVSGAKVQLWQSMCCAPDNQEWY